MFATAFTKHNAGMVSTREFNSARWHSRAGFLATTLLVLLVMGAPFLVTRGLIEHGALFLPAVLILLLAFGGPLVRIALATGRLTHRLQGREAVQPVQMLVRVTLTIVLLALAARAAGWIFSETFFGVPERALEFQARELTTASTAWHSSSTPALWSGFAVVAALTLMFVALCRRRRLAGLSWITGWVLAAAVLLLLMGLVVGYSLPGAGAVAAMAAPLAWEPVLQLVFWGDAASIAMLALGAQTAVLVAAGRGMPKRAAVGRDARILVAGVSFLTVLGGLVGLLLLSALCARQGIVPGVDHAAPGVLLLELVPALGRQLFPSWPDHLQPTGRQVTLAWCFLLCVSCSIGAAALLVSQRFFPRPANSRGALFGYGAGAAALLAVFAGWMSGTRDAWLPLITLMPALLAVMHLTLTRRAGADLRVVAGAFASTRPWIEDAAILFTFRFLRPLLLLAVLAVALSRREYGLVLAGFAVAFALMWVGSLRPRVRSRETGMLRAVSTAGVLLLLAGVVHAAPSPALQAFDNATNAEDPPARKLWRERFEARHARGSPVEIAAMQRRADMLLARSRDAERNDTQRRLDIELARTAVACLLVVDSASDESLRIERALLADDGLFPYARIDEAVSAHAGGQPEALDNLLRRVHERLQGRWLEQALARDADLAGLLFALVADMRDAYGAGGREAQRLRAHLLQRATAGRTLLKPQAGPGVVYILSLLAAASALALSLLLGVGAARPGVEPARVRR